MSVLLLGACLKTRKESAAIVFSLLEDNTLPGHINHVELHNFIYKPTFQIQRVQQPMHSETKKDELVSLD